MPSSDELSAAVGAGVIGRSDAEALAAFHDVLQTIGGSLALLGVGRRTLRRAVVSALIPPEPARRLPTLRTDQI
jgi:hypothetical protein